MKESEDLALVIIIFIIIFSGIFLANCQEETNSPQTQHNIDNDLCCPMQ